MNDRFERIVFLQHHEANEYIDAIREYGPESVLEDLSRLYHYPGEHEADTSRPWGTRDRTFQKDGYTLGWNPGLEYVSLTFDRSHATTDEHRRALESK